MSAFGGKADIGLTPRLLPSKLTPEPISPTAKSLL
jgi:hypothetical protein